MNDNKLITEFMGLEPTMMGKDLYGYSDSPFFSCTEKTPEKVMENIVKYVKYDKSWDWLMPVVEKINAMVSTTSDD